MLGQLKVNLDVCTLGRHDGWVQATHYRQNNIFDSPTLSYNMHPYRLFSLNR
jgi:hypothetical protein